MYRTARESVQRGWAYAYRDRRTKKRAFRRLWITRINAAARLRGLSYSAFMAGLSKVGVRIDRKILADLAIHDAEMFDALAEQAREALGR